ncbi:hypothetical protein HOU03_gp537 [Caulobacter phage CcrSC]|uniref:Cadherin domain-containing protein n=1 Tax=Caulobacter phage CcrSC TaxID=2283272 RepID=A0A385EDI8_9CAUD|nr:hypothetical protein HOU03_gp537 [Caulobacter phage CcrSC]AXQ69730.1 hypothetical protein CcrSC_gp148 [Caulobacter phage CcrSC]
MAKPLIAATKRQRLSPAHVPLIPTDIELSSTQVPAGSPAGTTIGILTAKPEVGEIDFVLLDDAGGKFAIDGARLVIGPVASAGATLNITVRAIARFSKLWVDKVFGVEVQTVVAPIILSPTNPTILENSPAGTQVAAISSPGSTLALTNNAGNRFALNGVNLQAGSVPTDYETATSHDVTISATNNGDTISEIVTVQVINVVEITNITLSANTIAENSAAGTVVGQLASVPAGATLTLTNNAGNRFAIDGSNRLVAGSVATDYETNTTHDVTVRATKGPDVYDKTFTINVTNVNELTDITLSANTIAENSAAGTVVGNLASVIAGASFTVTSQTPSGAYFTVNGSNQLVAGATPTNYEANTSHSVTIQATRGTDTFSKTFTVNVTNVTEITDFTLSANTITEGAAQTTQVGLFTSTPTGATYALAPDNTAGTLFQVSGTALQAGSTATNYENATSHVVKIRATRGGETLDKNFTINVTNVVELSDFTLSGSSIDENSGQGTGVGTLSSTPTGATYSFVAPNSSAGSRFQISGNALQAGPVSTDYESATSHAITIRASRGGETMDKNFTITVNDINEAPPPPDLDSFSLSGNSIDENSGAGTFVGTFSSSPSGASYVLTNSAGGRFAISGTSLVAGSTPTDYETATSHSISVNATRGATTLSDSFTINVNNLAEGGGGSQTLTVSKNKGNLTGSIVGGTTPPTTSETITATASGGTAPYSYDWEYVSGDTLIFLANVSPQEAYWYLGNGDRPANRTAIWRCKATDAVGNYGYTSNTQITLTWS